MEADQMPSFRGRVFTRCDGTPSQGHPWAFWMLRKSKKVWFQLPESLRHAEGRLLYRYRERTLLHRPTWRSLPAEERARIGAVILWGDEVVGGWGAGPHRTNHYLYIWTRWSLLHPGARHHPEAFTVTTGLIGWRNRSTLPPPGLGS
jgi:hypothetical protein